MGEIVAEATVSPSSRPDEAEETGENEGSGCALIRSRDIPPPKVLAMVTVLKLYYKLANFECSMHEFQKSSLD